VGNERAAVNKLKQCGEYSVNSGGVAHILVSDASEVFNKGGNGALRVNEGGKFLVNNSASDTDGSYFGNGIYPGSHTGGFQVKNDEGDIT